VYLGGVEPFFLAGGGTFTGEVMTPFSLDVVHPR
jgi:hypothetical protein